MEGLPLTTRRFASSCSSSREELLLRGRGSEMAIFTSILTPGRGVAGGVAAASSAFAGGRGDGDGDPSVGGRDGLDGLRKMSAKASSFERMLWKTGARLQGLKRGTKDGRKRVKAEVRLDASEDGPDGRGKKKLLHTGSGSERKSRSILRAIYTRCSNTVPLFLLSLSLIHSNIAK